MPQGALSRKTGEGSRLDGGLHRMSLFRQGEHRVLYGGGGGSICLGPWLGFDPGGGFSWGWR